MGRPRRVAKNEKEEKELERLRENQKNCRQRKLDKVDEYKKQIDTLNSEVQQKVNDFSSRMSEFQHLRTVLIDRGMNDRDQQTLWVLQDRMKQLVGKVEDIRSSIKELDRPAS